MGMFITREIQADPETVFQALADFPGAAERVDGIKAIEMVTDGPVGTGTRFRETRVMFGKDTTEELMVVDFDPPNSYSVQANSCGSLFTTRVAVVPRGDGSEVTMDIDIQPQSLFAKLMKPLSWLMAGPMKRMIAKDLADIQRGLENPLPQSAS